MAFDLAVWKEQAANKLRNGHDWLKARMQRNVPYVAYGALCSLTIWPLVQAAQGDFSSAIGALMTFGTNLGINLIANNFQKWKDEADAADGIAQAVQADPALRANLDKILNALEAARHAQAGQHEQDRAVFVAELREVAKQVGSTITINTGGGAYIEGSVTAQTLVGRDQFIIENYIAQIVQTGAGESEATALELVREYLDDAMRRCAKMKWDAITDAFVRQGNAPPELADVFVPLDVRFGLPEGYETLADFAAKRKRRKDKPGRVDDVLRERGREEKRVPATDVLGTYPRAVLLGKPGSGKTTLSAFVVLHLARAAGGDAAALTHLGESWTHGALMPVQIILRRLADSLPANCKQGNASHIWDFLRRHAGLPEQERLVDVLRRITRKHGAMFVFDGLDECGDDARQARVREAVADFMDTAGEQCRFLITARPYAWDNPAHERGEFTLDDLTPDQVQLFIRQWFERLHAKGWFDDAERDDKLARLREFVQRDDVRELAANPLLLTLMAMLQSNQLKLPDERVELYADVVKLSLERWTRKAGDDQSLPATLGKSDAIMDRIREAIERVAFEAHERHAGKAGDVELDANDLRVAFARVLDGDMTKAEAALDYIEYRAGLLIGEGARGDKRKFSLIHQTFQAWLAARHLARQPDFLKQAQSLARADIDHWRTALVMAARMERDRTGILLTEQLVYGQPLDEFVMARGEPTLHDWRAAILAGEQFCEIGRDYALGSDDGQRACTRIVSWLLAAMTSRTLANPKLRVTAGDVLARLGDPRFHDASLFHLPKDDALGFIRIPAGTFNMGTRKEDFEKVMTLCGVSKDSWRHYESEINPRPETHTDAYYIARYPVTVAQFRLFVEDKKIKLRDDDALQGPAHPPGALRNVVRSHAVLRLADRETQGVRPLRGV